MLIGSHINVVIVIIFEVIVLQLSAGNPVNIMGAMEQENLANITEEDTNNGTEYAYQNITDVTQLNSSSLETFSTNDSAALDEDENNFAYDPPLGSLETGDATPVPTAEPCPVGFIRHKDSCYHIVGSSELTWHLASTYCQLHGSKLVEINSDSEQKMVEAMIRTNNDGDAYWIGATNRHGRGNWTWDSSSEPLEFSWWVSRWNGWVNEIETVSCALIDTSEFSQWMFWPCEYNFFMTGKKHTRRTEIGLICEKESPRPARTDRQGKSKRRRRQRRKNRRNLLNTRHWRRFQ